MDRRRIVNLTPDLESWVEWVETDSSALLPCGNRYLAFIENLAFIEKRYGKAVL